VAGNVGQAESSPFKISAGERGGFHLGFRGLLTGAAGAWSPMTVRADGQQTKKNSHSHALPGNRFRYISRMGIHRAPSG
jgi:hypothetical protein